MTLSSFSQDISKVDWDEHIDYLINDLEELIKKEKCGPLLIRLSFHDACVYSTGKYEGGCPKVD